MNSLEGLDLHSENVDENDALDDEDSELENKKPVGDRAHTTMDLQNAVMAVTDLFPEDTKPIGGDSEPIKSCLEPIIEQI